jgi:hypothetical protein
MALADEQAELDKDRANVKRIRAELDAVRLCCAS